MEQQAHFSTIATADLDAARRFYVEGLGRDPLLDVPDEIIFFRIARAGAGPLPCGRVQRRYLRRLR
ncbi:hypothetical protein [Nocardia testacea]|uniref:hypothetical protein n=1 Tax=Nocardia testacea TaxID=248551 RepID=UPI003A8A3325